MLIKNAKNLSIISILSDVFYSYTKIDRSLLNEYDIYISDNIAEDIKIFENIKCSTSFDGTVLFPSSTDKPNKMAVLFTDNANSYLHAVPHELCHVHDFYLFCKQYCDYKYTTVRNNPKHMSFLYWSEFHVKSIEIYCTFLALNIINEENNTECFQNNLELFYNKYSDKLANKSKPQIIDFMYYIGELYTCNLYNPHSETQYTVRKDLIVTYPFLPILYEVFSNSPSFDLYVENQKEISEILLEATQYL